MKSHNIRGKIITYISKLSNDILMVKYKSTKEEEDNIMTEVWEASFIRNQAMWGFEPSESAVWTKDFFVEQSFKDILIHGIGYGRNAKIFIDNGINVDGIEISKTAIELAKENVKGINNIYHGSVSSMPFNYKLYDGIFCYALIHLLDFDERKKFIHDCYNQLKRNGCMVFITASKKARLFKQGREVSEDTFEVMDGVNMFFYDEDSIKEEFKDFGLEEVTEFYEAKNNLHFMIIRCRKK